MFSFDIQKIDGTNSSIDILCGEVTFFVGGNGSGKSSLINQLYRQHGNEKSVYIAAHRKNTFDKDIIDFSNSEYKDAKQRAFHASKSETSRYRNVYEYESINLPIVTLKNKSIAHAIENHNLLKRGEGLENLVLHTEIDQINDIFKNSGLGIEFFIDNESNLMANNFHYSPSRQYPLSKMSDGEKSALIICCQVLCADHNALIVLDEPERHLHKKIVSHLLSNLIESRRDCAFVISTHELTLPSFFKDSTVISVRNCFYQNDYVIQWDISIINNYDEALNGLDEQVKIDVLGARNNILFVEGTQSSLDTELYTALFENVSVVSKEKCDLVEIAVKGLRHNPFAHWINAVGIIDNDNKVQSQIENLNSQFIFSLSVHSIESIYYHPKIIRWVLESVQETNLTTSVNECFEEICNLIFNALQDKKEHLCCRAIEKKVRAEIMSSIPTQRDIQNGGTYEKNFDFSSFLQEEITYFEQLLESRDYELLMSRYPIRETNLLTPIAKKCGFLDRKRYEMNVVRVIKNNALAKEFVLSLLGGAANAIN
ncbi:AAA family ATPase (plasmid) [Acinetobacter baumannii]|uniref:AAA family ATPase n=1 Tax=Acinetobacter baumannii TaxID=470 RepID=UPI001FF173D5|nr:AAA family ATPase [Acinetobacter baumannii]MCJ9259139.1 ATP-binding protein [Acinetobacter baumannii]MDC4552650.1 ATP-binding protein [Acinetobacter baumannii]